MQRGALGGTLFRPLSRQAFRAAARPVRAGCTLLVAPVLAASLLARSKVASGRGWRVIVSPAEPSPKPACSPCPETESAFSTWYSRPWAARLCCPRKGVHPDQGRACVNTGWESVSLSPLLHTLRREQGWPPGQGEAPRGHGCPQTGPRGAGTPCLPRAGSLWAA